MSEQDINEVFNGLAMRQPLLLAGTIPFALSRSSLIVSDGNNTLTKILFKNLDPEQQQRNEAGARVEVRALDFFKYKQLQDIQTPLPLSTPVPINDDQFSLFYRMTKIDGRSAHWNWQSPAEFTTKSQQKSHFFNAGEVLAKFHKATASVPSGDLCTRDHTGGQVEQIHNGDPEINSALTRADRYLQAHKRSATLHGDFHGGNVMADKTGRITGLLDFSYAHYAENHMMDFINVPPEGLPYFYEGYERESGQTIDPMMFTMTRISMLAESINYSLTNKEHGAEYLAEHQKELNERLVEAGLT